MITNKAHNSILYIVCIISTICVLSACANSGNGRLSEDRNIVKDTNVVAKMLLDFRDNHPTMMRNQITREEAAIEFQKVFCDSINKNDAFLSNIPAQYVQCLQNGSTYMVKFEYSKYNDCPELLDSIRLVYTVFSIIDKQSMVQLEDKKLYVLSGVCKGSVNDKITLPSGNTFYMNPSIREDDPVLHKDELVFNAGGLLFANLKFECVE